MAATMRQATRALDARVAGAGAKPVCAPVVSRGIATRQLAAIERTAGVAGPSYVEVRAQRTPPQMARVGCRSWPRI